MASELGGALEAPTPWRTPSAARCTAALAFEGGGRREEAGGMEGTPVLCPTNKKPKNTRGFHEPMRRAIVSCSVFEKMARRSLSLGVWGGAALVAVLLESLTPGLSRSLQTPAFVATVPVFSAPAPAARRSDDQGTSVGGGVGRDSFPSPRRACAQAEIPSQQKESTVDRCARIAPSF